MLSIAVASMLFALVASYPTGAPIETCKLMTANHTGHESQTSEPKYEILLDPSTISSGGEAGVTLQGVGVQFKGFFIQGRDESTNEPVGMFKSQSDAQTLDCSGPGSANAITHVDAKEKDKIYVKWQAPANYKGKVVFRCIVVQSYEVFWDNLQSSPMTVE